jgi:hypothetical protein
MGGAQSFTFLGDGRVLCGSCDEVHVSCEDRINLYPAAPFRLATMLNAWIITERWDGANLSSGPIPPWPAGPRPRPTVPGSLWI